MDESRNHGKVGIRVKEESGMNPMESVHQESYWDEYRHWRRLHCVLFRFWRTSEVIWILYVLSFTHGILLKEISVRYYDEVVMNDSEGRITMKYLFHLLFMELGADIPIL